MKNPMKNYIVGLFMFSAVFFMGTGFVFADSFTQTQIDGITRFLKDLGASDDLVQLLLLKVTLLDTMTPAPQPVTQPVIQPVNQPVQLPANQSAPMQSNVTLDQSANLYTLAQSMYDGTNPVILVQPQQGSGITDISAEGNAISWKVSGDKMDNNALMGFAIYPNEGDLAWTYTSNITSVSSSNRMLPQKGMAEGAFNFSNPGSITITASDSKGSSSLTITNSVN
jgi:hypothetical protein